MENKGISDKELSNYYSGKMNDQERHDFESRATDDDFIADATDGFMDNPEAIESLGNLKEKFHQKHSIPSGLSGKSIMILGTALALVIVFSIVFLVKWNTEPENKPLASSKTDDKVVKQDQNIPVVEDPIDLDTSNNPITEEARVIEREKPISPQKVIVEQKEINTYEDELSVEKLQKRNVLKIEMNNKELSIQKKKVAYHYLADFKVVDYSGIYKNSSLTKDDLNGLPARFEKEKEIIENEPRLIKYEDFLERALIELKRENHMECIKMLQKIQNTFPDDLNASFYQGIAYFNLKDYKHAGKSFEKALSSSYFIFDEETEWYLYLCKKALGEKKEAARLLKQIKKRKGFYYNRAMQE